MGAGVVSESTDSMLIAELGEVVSDLVDDPLVVGPVDLDPVGQPAGMGLGVGPLGWRGRDLVALGDQALKFLIQAGELLLRMETSIRIANSPPRRAMRLVSTFPPRSSSSPVTRSTIPTRSGPVRVRTKFLCMKSDSNPIGGSETMHWADVSPEPSYRGRSLASCSG